MHSVLRNKIRNNVRGRATFDRKHAEFVYLHHAWDDRVKAEYDSDSRFFVGSAFVDQMTAIYSNHIDQLNIVIAERTRDALGIRKQNI